MLEEETWEKYENIKINVWSYKNRYNITWLYMKRYYYKTSIKEKVIESFVV